MKHKLILGLLVVSLFLVSGCGNGNIQPIKSKCYDKQMPYTEKECEFKEFSYNIDYTSIYYDELTQRYLIDEAILYNNEDKEGVFTVFVTYYQEGVEVGRALGPATVTIPAHSSYHFKRLHWPTNKVSNKDIKLKVIESPKKETCKEVIKYKTERVCE